jgi:hypothetical protein
MPIRANIRLWSVLCSCLTPLSLWAGADLSFEPNRGQTGAEIRYLARTRDGVIFVTDRGLTLSGQGQTAPAFDLLGANLSTNWIPEADTGETISYYIGRDSAKWFHDVPRYERLVRRNVYPGIDLVLYGSGGQMEYDFLLAPHADPSRIRLKLTGARAASIGGDGALIVNTPGVERRHRKPVVMETLADGSRRNLPGAFRILGHDEVGFSVDGHDPALALSIDPVLEASTYFGGHGDDQVVSTDGRGTLVGMTTSIDVPGAQFVRRKGTDVFVKVAQEIIVIGGSGNETVTSAAFPPPYGNVFVAVGGYTNSTDLPTNINSFINNNQTPPLQPNYGGGATDGFLLIFNQSSVGNPVPTLTYIGGPGDDRINAIAMDPYSLTLAIVGETNGGGLPLPPYVFTPIQASPAGGLDGFVIMAAPLQYEPLRVYSTTYLGGSGDDTALGVAMVGGVCYVTGETKSPDFPLKNAFYSKRKGDSDAFIVEITYGGTTLAASTLFGGSGSDRGVAATILSNGNVAVAGVTSSTDLPLLDPTQKAYGGGASDAFVTQFTDDLSALVSSTYIGGSESDEATSIVSAVPNTIFVGGWTASQNFPTKNALQPKYGGGPDDGFLVHFDDDGSIYEATVFGGSGSDRVLGLTPAYAGPTVWLVGETTSPNLPLQNASQTSLRGNSNGFVAEVTTNLFSVAPFKGGKDLRSPVQIFYGNPDLAGATAFTITSSDPSKVQVATDQSSPGRTSVALVPPANNTSALAYADCLTDSGGADLTVTAPGYGSRTVHASCLPQAIAVPRLYAENKQI